jgi:hypothetical protein
MSKTNPVVLERLEDMLPGDRFTRFMEVGVG